MKDKKLKKLIQKPLRFHHQDIHEELDEIKGMLKNVINQMQSLQQRNDQHEQDPVLRMPQYDNREGG
jgi:paraquat-inducible protein B